MPRGGPTLAGSRAVTARAAGSVEAAFLPGDRLARDSKLGDASPVLAGNLDEWSVFTAVVKAGSLNG